MYLNGNHYLPIIIQTKYLNFCTFRDIVEQFRTLFAKDISMGKIKQCLTRGDEEKS